MSLPGFAAVVSALLCPLPPPFILELPVLVLHAVGCGVSSVGTRALDLSHWGGSELREANLHSGKPFCQSASLWLRFSVSSYLPFYILTSSVLPLSWYSSLSLTHIPLWSLAFHFSYSTVHRVFCFSPHHSHSLLHQRVICYCQLQLVLIFLFDYANHYHDGDRTSAGDFSSCSERLREPQLTTQSWNQFCWRSCHQLQVSPCCITAVQPHDLFIDDVQRGSWVRWKGRPNQLTAGCTETRKVWETDGRIRLEWQQVFSA